jgi:hypothetical protein
LFCSPVTSDPGEVGEGNVFPDQDMPVKTPSRLAVTPLASTSAIHLVALGALHLLLVHCTLVPKTIAPERLVDARSVFVYDEISTGAQVGGPVLPSQANGPYEGGKEDV